MLLDVQQLMKYYATPGGVTVLRSMTTALSSVVPDLRGKRVLGYGFPQPYLPSLTAGAERALAFMPAQMGCISWPDRSSVTVLGDESLLPFPESFFDAILVLHGLEGAENPRLLLRHLWRLLAPDGQLILAVPNRVSLWTISEGSPFGCGRPFRKTELSHMLQQCMFQSDVWKNALYFPPWTKSPRTAALWDKYLPRIMPGCGGVHLVRAQKNLYGTPPVCIARVYPIHAPQPDAALLRTGTPNARVSKAQKTTKNA